MKNYHIYSGVILFTLFVFGCSSSHINEIRQRNIAVDEYAIAYNVLTDREADNYEVFTMNFDGSDKTNITNLSGVEWTYYSFRDKLYFISDKDTCHRCYFLYRTDYRGNLPEKVSEFQLADSWMSSRNNGTEIIVRPKADSAFYIIGQNGKLLKKIYTGLPYATDPLFISEGKQIVFRGSYKKFKQDNGYIDELFIINDDGTGLKQLTNYPKSDTTAKWYNYHAGPPKLHPVEKFITYQSLQNGKYSLFAVTSDGKKQWKLTDNNVSEGWHDWSEDGRWLAIEVYDKEESRFHIALMNWETKDMRIITDSTFKNQQAPNFIKKTKNSSVIDRLKN